LDGATDDHVALQRPLAVMAPIEVLVHPAPILGAQRLIHVFVQYVFKILAAHIVLLCVPPEACAFHLFGMNCSRLRIA
jgi:hypothetical protein